MAEADGEWATEGGRAGGREGALVDGSPSLVRGGGVKSSQGGEE